MLTLRHSRFYHESELPGVLGVCQGEVCPLPDVVILVVTGSGTEQELHLAVMTANKVGFYHHNSFSNSNKIKSELEFIKVKLILLQFVVKMSYSL